MPRKDFRSPYIAPLLVLEIILRSDFPTNEVFPTDIFLSRKLRLWLYRFQNNFIGKGDVIERKHYTGLKLLGQMYQVIEKMIVPIIRDQIDINSAV